MDITYKNKKIEKECTDASVAEKNYGREMAVKICLRIDQITASATIEEMISNHIGRCHQLKNNRKGEYALDLVQPYRLVFEKNGKDIQVVRILEIVDYH